ncbi:MAG TPA: DNA mismatch repair endonuclease MutL [Clostridiales bacterium]|nr:DNA mismatch repair endonuclease MutL [Clostridiales bacterium]
MSIINVLDEATINQIAAGEVVERPSAVVKELVENALDAGSNAITVEIKDGGLSLIRITDNGSGIDKEDIPLAFLRHATSKIKLATDLLSVNSLGFRGEALSSISAVAQVELITKTSITLTGSRYIIEGGIEKSNDDIGCPNGTTIIVRNLFYNTPARRNFLKSATTEGNLISELMEKLMVSHPNVSFKFIMNNKVILQSSGNNNSKDILYNIYGRDLAKELIAVDYESDIIKVTGFIGKPSINRGNRNHENYFINGRYIKSSVITKAIEEAYKPYLMQRKFPFTSLYFNIKPEYIDVNVHPQKLEIRLTNNSEVYSTVVELIKDTLNRKNMIPDATFSSKKSIINKANTINKDEYLPEPFEVKRKEDLNIINENNKNYNKTKDNKAEQISVFTEDKLTDDTPFISVEAFHGHRIIGQVFATYWLVEYNEELFIIDQHAAHEKVLFERIINSINTNNNSQMLYPPILISLSLMEVEVVNNYKDVLCQIGYEIEHFGGKEYSVRAVPSGLYGLSEQNMLMEFIDNLSDELPTGRPEIIIDKIASMSCKAAVKANHTLSFKEAEALIKELLTLDNPYHCPHGRPIIISMSKYEFEKKFKRII